MELNNNVERLKDFADYLVQVTSCNLCGSEDRLEWAKSDPIIAFQCHACGLIYHGLQLTRQGRDLFYASGYFELENDQEDAAARDKMYGIEIENLERFCRAGKILDVGCGGGFLLNKLSSSWEKHGVEFDEKAARHANNVFKLNVKQGEVNEHTYKPNFFDVIVLRGVIEHMADPKAMLMHLVPWLKPGGLIYITSTPNAESLCAELYREKWRLFTADHQLHFTKRTIVELFKGIGCNLLDSNYFYLETPYAHEVEDYRKIIDDAKLISTGRKNEIDSSPAFYGSMLSLIFKRL
jgi:2-polyprenyl-3-methyl-5-hydroxy-6-metoxy-1,4-benzoquinol methylase